MGKLMQRSMAELLRQTSRLSKPQMTMVLEGKVRMEGPLDKTNGNPETEDPTVCCNCWNTMGGSQVLCCGSCGKTYHNFCLEPPHDVGTERKQYCYRCPVAGSNLSTDQGAAIKPAEVITVIEDEEKTPSIIILDDMAEDSTTSISVKSTSSPVQHSPVSHNKKQSQQKRLLINDGGSEQKARLEGVSTKAQGEQEEKRTKKMKTTKAESVNKESVIGCSLPGLDSGNVDVLVNGVPSEKVETERREDSQEASSGKTLSDNKPAETAPLAFDSGSNLLLPVDIPAAMVGEGIASKDLSMAIEINPDVVIEEKANRTVDDGSTRALVNDEVLRKVFDSDHALSSGAMTDTKGAEGIMEEAVVVVMKEVNLHEGETKPAQPSLLEDCSVVPALDSSANNGDGSTGSVVIIPAAVQEIPPIQPPNKPVSSENTNNKSSDCRPQDGNNVVSEADPSLVKQGLGMDLKDDIMLPNLKMGHKLEELCMEPIAQEEAVIESQSSLKEEPECSQQFDASASKMVIDDDAKVCDICGDAGFEDMLAICSECNEGAEHTYCMRVCLDQVPEQWCCEGCKGKPKLVAGSQQSEAARGSLALPRNSNVPSLLSSPRKLSFGSARSRLSARLEKRKLGSTVDRRRFPLLPGVSGKQHPPVIRRPGSGEEIPSLKQITTEISARKTTDDVSTRKRQAEDTLTGLPLKQQAIESPSSPKGVIMPITRPNLSRELSIKNPDSGKVKFIPPASVTCAGQRLPNSIRGPGKVLTSPPVSSNLQSPKLSAIHAGYVPNRGRFGLPAASLTGDSMPSSPLKTISSSQGGKSAQINPLSSTSKSGDTLPSFLLPSNKAAFPVKALNSHKFSREGQEGALLLPGNLRKARVEKLPVIQATTENSTSTTLVEKRSPEFSVIVEPVTNASSAPKPGGESKFGVIESLLEPNGKLNSSGTPPSATSMSHEILNTKVSHMRSESPVVSKEINETALTQQPMGNQGTKVEAALNAQDRTRTSQTAGENCEVGAEKGVLLDNEGERNKINSFSVSLTSPKVSEEPRFSELKSSHLGNEPGNIQLCSENTHEILLSSDDGKIINSPKGRPLAWTTSSFMPLVGSTRCYKCKEYGHSAQSCATRKPLKGFLDMAGGGKSKLESVSSATPPLLMQDLESAMKVESPQPQNSSWKSQASGMEIQDLASPSVLKECLVISKCAVTQTASKETQCVKSSCLDTMDMSTVALQSTEPVLLESVQIDPSGSKSLEERTPEFLKQSSVPGSDTNTNVCCNSKQGCDMIKVSNNLPPSDRSEKNADGLNQQLNTEPLLNEPVQINPSGTKLLAGITLESGSDRNTNGCYNSSQGRAMINASDNSPPNDSSEKKADGLNQHSCQSVPKFNGLMKPMKLPVLPELYILWRGSFCITSEGSRCNVFDGILARPSNQAVQKVHDVTKKFQSQLQLEELPRSTQYNSWPTQFLNSPPNDENIALYFAPRDDESYEEFYKPLVDHMIKHDRALKGHVEDAELLVFPSTQLPENSLAWNQYPFLWAVFRDKKISNTQDPGHVMTPKEQQQVNSAHLKPTEQLRIPASASDRYMEGNNGLVLSEKIAKNSTKSFTDMQQMATSVTVSQASSHRLQVGQPLPLLSMPHALSIAPQFNEPIEPCSEKVAVCVTKLENCSNPLQSFVKKDGSGESPRRIHLSCQSSPSPMVSLSPREKPGENWASVRKFTRSNSRSSPGRYRERERERERMNSRDYNYDRARDRDRFYASRDMYREKDRDRRFRERGKERDRERERDKAGKERGKDRGERDRERNRDRDRERDREREREREREKDREADRGWSRHWDRDRVRDRDREREWGGHQRDREREKDWVGERDGGRIHGRRRDRAYPVMEHEKGNRYRERCPHSRSLSHSPSGPRVRSCSPPLRCKRNQDKYKFRHRSRSYSNSPNSDQGSGWQCSPFKQEDSREKSQDSYTAMKKAPAVVLVPDERVSENKVSRERLDELAEPCSSKVEHCASQEDQVLQVPKESHTTTIADLNENPSEAEVGGMVEPEDCVSLSSTPVAKADADHQKMTFHMFIPSETPPLSCLEHGETSHSAGKTSTHHFLSTGFQDWMGGHQDLGLPSSSSTPNMYASSSEIVPNLDLALGSKEASPSEVGGLLPLFVRLVGTPTPPMKSLTPGAALSSGTSLDISEEHGLELSLSFPQPSIDMHTLAGNMSSSNKGRESVDTSLSLFGPFL